MTRWKFNPKDKTNTRYKPYTTMNTSGEFARIDDRFVTKYYKHEWDDEAKRTKQSASPKDFTAEQEQATLVKFAEHHMLKHRFAVMNNTSGFDEAYGRLWNIFRHELNIRTH